MLGSIKGFFEARTKLVYVLVALSYLLLTVYYMTPSLTHCTSEVYGFGDNTGGVIWRHQVSPSSPLWGFEKVTNYPFGEHLDNPINYSGTLQYTWYWTLAKVGGAICGFNMFNAIGFVSAATVMYAFVYKLTRRRSIAWLAGYAVSFTPYFQYKVGGHPSYGYSALLIGVIWAAYELIRGPTRKKATILGLITAACFYWDPYFILLSLSILIPFCLTALIYLYLVDRAQGKIEFKQTLKSFLVAAGAAFILVLPLGIVRVAYSQQINSYTAGARGDVLSDMEHYSNLPFDYFLPSSDQYFLQKLIGSRYNPIIRKFHPGSNQSEFNTGLSWIITAVVSSGLIIMAWEKLNRRRLFNSRNALTDYKLLTLSASVVMLFAAALATPPIIGGLRFPSFILYKLTSTWRVLSREYIVVNIVLVLLFSIILKFFFDRAKIKNHALYIVTVILFLGIFLQYQAFKPFTGSAANFRYEGDVPKTIYWLREQKEIKTLAAYPLDKDGEGVGPSTYLTFEGIDKKKLLNSVLPNSPQEPIRYSIRDLTAPQTLPILRQLGIDAAEIHFLPLDQIQNIPGLQILKYENFVSAITNGQIAIGRILPGPKLDYAVTPQSGFPFNGSIMVSAVENQYEAVNRATIKIQNILTNKTGQVPACFDIKTASIGDHDTVHFWVNGKEIAAPLTIDDQYQTAQLVMDRGATLTLKNQTGHDMRLSKLGCQAAS